MYINHLEAAVRFPLICVKISRENLQKERKGSKAGKLAFGLGELVRQTDGGYIQYISRYNEYMVRIKRMDCEENNKSTKNRTFGSLHALIRSHL